MQGLRGWEARRASEANPETHRDVFSETGTPQATANHSDCADPPLTAPHRRRRLGIRTRKMENSRRMVDRRRHSWAVLSGGQTQYAKGLPVLKLWMIMKSLQCILDTSPLRHVHSRSITSKHLHMCCGKACWPRRGRTLSRHVLSSCLVVPFKSRQSWALGKAGDDFDVSRNCATSTD